MKKNKIKTLLICMFVLILLIIPNYSNAETSTYNSNSSSMYSTYNNYPYVISKYHIEMVVNEDNTFDITEIITAYFNVDRHGIYRKIPLRNDVTRLDGTTSKNRAQITDISVSDKCTIYNENGYKVIKIGDENQTLTGSKTYTIKYKYNIGKDPLKNADEFYFNLIGNEWDTSISNVSFNIQMPKEFDKNLLGFSRGPKGSTSDENIMGIVNENTIFGTVKDSLMPGEAFTIRLNLPEGYFVGAGQKMDKFSIFVIILSVIFVVIAYMMWKKYGKDDPVIETVEFYPPEGRNPAEIGFLYEGSASDEAVISLLIYLANKGYLKIEEYEEKVLFSKTKGFRITKLKEYDGNNTCEKMFIDGLFSGARTGTVNMNKVREIMKEAKNNGEKMSLADAIELSMPAQMQKETVTNMDLYNSFYLTLNRIKSYLNDKKNKNKIFEPIPKRKEKWITLMNIAIFILISLKPIMEYYGEIFFIIPILIFPGLGFSLAFDMLFFSNNTTIYVNGTAKKSSWGTKIFAIIWGGMFGGMPWLFMMLPCLLQNTIHFITYFIGIACIAILKIIKHAMPKRTPYGNEILGKIRGFKRFLETAEKQQLESLVMQNPEYFYDILPYTYVLGISDKWISQFETIALQAPKWYDSYDNFDVGTFGVFMASTMKSATTAMLSSPSSSSSGGSSGGGSSGGGSGGGGGGSW